MAQNGTFAHDGMDTVSIMIQEIQLCTRSSHPENLDPVQRLPTPAGQDEVLKPNLFPKWTRSQSTPAYLPLLWPNWGYQVGKVRGCLSQRKGGKENLSISTSPLFLSFQVPQSRYLLGNSLQMQSFHPSDPQQWPTTSINQNSTST